MDTPWKIKESDERGADSMPTFIIFCEDEVSEPIYLKYFETSKIKINLIKGQKSMMANVLSAVSHCKENGLIEYREGEDSFVSQDTQVWCVFDRDKEDEPDKIKKGNTEFDESIKTAISNGLKVAWSNDAFELWVLLHFEDVEMNDVKRITYYQRLSEIFKNIENPNEDLIKALKYHNFSYKDNLKSENNFRYIVRKEIVNKTNDAIKRAIVLEKFFAKKDVQSHERVPCTLMHHLITELIKLGGKVIDANV